MTSSEKPVTVPNAVKFAFGGLSGMGATCVVQPLDLIKNRMQILGAEGGKRVTSLNVVSKLIKTEGVLALYSGLSAGLLRQASYTTVRMGVYNSLLDSFAVDGKTTLIQQSSFGAIAGATGAFIGTPAEVSLVRMTADGRLPLDQRRNYKNVFNALSRIVSEEGYRTLWKGCVPTMGRSVVVNTCQLASYSQAKERLLRLGYLNEGILLHFTASMISGLLTTFASMPIDIAKTRLQNMKIVDGKPEYRGAIDVMLKVIRKEGFLNLWRGFFPYYARIGPHTVLTFILQEQLYSIYREKMA